MSDLLGKGFQILSIEGDKSIEVLYWLAPNAMCFTTWERPFDIVRFDKAGQQWNVSEGLPENAVYIGTYPKPAGVSEVLARNCEGWTNFSHSKACWAFDSDQLAEWSSEEDDFHFHSFHKLAEPTIDSVGSFIDQRIANGASHLALVSSHAGEVTASPLSVVVRPEKLIQAQAALHDAGFTIPSVHPLLDDSGDLVVPGDFEMVHTGGGCMALRRDVGDFYMLLTTGDGCDVPDLDDWEDNLIGVYRNEDNEEIACVTASEWFEVMGEQVPLLRCPNTP